MDYRRSRELVSDLEALPKEQFARAVNGRDVPRDVAEIAALGRRIGGYAKATVVALAIGVAAVVMGGITYALSADSVDPAEGYRIAWGFFVAGGVALPVAAVLRVLINSMGARYQELIRKANLHGA